jgi:acyl-CoA thioester hydrolase
MGVVYYANYLRFFEAGRTELLRALRIPYREIESDGYFLPVSRAEVRYHAPARYDDPLVLETELAEVRRASLQIRYRLTREDDQVLIASGITEHACLGPGNRVTRLPLALREALDAVLEGEG